MDDPQELRRLLEEAKTTIQERDATIQENYATIQEKDATIQQKDATIQEKDSLIEKLKLNMRAIKQDTPAASMLRLGKIKFMPMSSHCFDSAYFDVSDE